MHTGNRDQKVSRVWRGFDTMSNPSKKKGTAAETKVVKFLREHGIDAKRVALNGSKDVGDIHFKAKGSIRMLEVKAGVQAKAPSRSQLEEWMRQTDVERINLNNSELSKYDYVFGYLVVVRYGRKIQDADVYFTQHASKGDQIYRRHYYLDEFVAYILE